MKTTRMEINEDIIEIENEEGGRFVIAPLGGPDDPLSIEGIGSVEINLDQLDELQRALANYTNTGYFDVEG